MKTKVLTIVVLLLAKNHHNRCVAIMLRSSSWIHKTAWSKTVQSFPDTASSQVWKRTIPLRNVQHHWNILGPQGYTWYMMHPLLICLLQSEDSWWKFQSDQGPDPKRSQAPCFDDTAGVTSGHRIHPQVSHVMVGGPLGWAATFAAHKNMNLLWSSLSMSIPCSCQVYTKLWYLCHVKISYLAAMFLYAIQNAIEPYPLVI